jgi:hypothetical protein
LEKRSSMNKALFVLTLVVAISLLSVPAFAAVTVNAPEPVTLALVATGIGAVAVARKFLKK